MPSTIEILVRTGRVLPLKRPARSEKGLQDVSSRDGFDRPVLLGPVLQDPMLNKFELDHRKLVAVEMENPGKDWVAGLNTLGNGTVIVAQNVVQVKETKRVDWEDLRNLVLFRYRCGNSPIFLVEMMLEVQPSILHGLEDAAVMDNDNADEGGDDTVSEGSKIVESDVEMLDEGVTESDDG
jgi:hypothetical protein